MYHQSFFVSIDALRHSTSYANLFFTDNLNHLTDFFAGLLSVECISFYPKKASKKDKN